MSVVGCDFGSLNTVIAVARNRGVDVITNEVSNRATPTLVAFGPRSRYVGEAAKTQEISNLKNTVSSLTRLAGRSLADPDVQIEQDYISAKLVDIHGQVGAEVSYLGKKEQFNATQLCAMYFTKVKATAAAELKQPVSDIVLSCPPWYTDPQRRSILDAAEIAGLKCLRLINDTTATALGYGITKLDLPGPEENPRRVAFVDIGHSTYTCSIVEFRKGELAIKSTVSDRHFGGRNVDKALVDHFAKEFKEKFKIDINENPKARFRVIAAVEKLKKILSANTGAPIGIESVMNDVDVKGFMKRDELEELIKPLLDHVTQPIEQALADAKLSVQDLDAIEMVGGCTRVPAIKNAIQKFFDKPLSFTLNQDEAIARGCAFSCAILSPVFRVRDFTVHDIISYPIEFTWEKSPDIPDEDTCLTVFNKGNVLPSTKILTFYRKQPFNLEARYANPKGLPGKMNPWIGRFSVKGVKPTKDDDFMICKLKARINLHGVLNLEQGYFVEDIEVEEPVPESKEGEKKEAEKKDPDVRLILSLPTRPASVEDGIEPEIPSSAGGLKRRRESAGNKPDAAKRQILVDAKLARTEDVLTFRQAMDTEQPNGDATKPKIVKKRKQVRKGDLPLTAGTASMDEQSKNRAAETEAQMIAEDKLVADTEHKKNELESFIYEMRGHVDEKYAEFASEEEKDKIRAKCAETEDWLYDEGEDATKAVYVSKIEEIRSVAGPVIQRYLDKLQAEEEKRRAEEEAKRKAEEESRKAAEEARKAAEEAKKAAEAASQTKDEEMKDADQPEVEEPADAKE